MVDIRQLARDLAVGEDPHLEFEQIAAYAEGSADALDRELVESHIAHCMRCRREVRDLQSFARPRRRWVWAAAAAAVLVASLAFFNRDPWRDHALVIPQQAVALRQTELALRGATHGQQLEPLSPIGRIVVDDRPTFEWSTSIPHARYRVEIFDERFRPVASSDLLSAARWTPPSALPRGGTFLWQVTAYAEGAEVTAPAPPAPEARFQVLDASRASSIEKLARSESRPSIALGVAYAEAGALAEAERELREVVAKRDGASAARFLRIVQAHTR